MLTGNEAGRNTQETPSRFKNGTIPPALDTTYIPLGPLGGGRAHRQPGKTLGPPAALGAAAPPSRQRKGKTGLVWVEAALPLALQSGVGEKWAWGVQTHAPWTQPVCVPLRPAPPAAAFEPGGRRGRVSGLSGPIRVPAPRTTHSVPTKPHPSP